MLRLTLPLLLRFLILIVLSELVILAPSISLLPAYITLHDSQRMIGLLLLALVLTHGIVNRQNQNSVFVANNNLRNVLLVLLMSAGISTYLALSSRFAVIEISVFVALSFLSLFIAELVQENKEGVVKAITYCLWASILLYMFAFYVGYITACVYKTPLKWPHPFLGFNNIRFFNQYQLWTIGLIYLPLLNFKLKSKTYNWLFLALSCWWVLLFYSASRGVLVAWFAGVLITLLTYKKLSFPILRLQIITLLTGYCSYFFLFKIMPDLLHSTLVTGTVIRDTTSDRLALWNIAIDLIKKFPIFGVGPMNYPFYSPASFHPHNSVLQLAAEFGLPATIVFLATISHFFYNWIKRFQPNNLVTNFKIDCNYVILLYFTIVTNLAYSMVDGVIVMPISQVMMFTVIGLMIGQYSSCDTSEKTKKPQKYNQNLRPVISTVVLVFLIWSTFPEIANGLSGYEKGFAVGPKTINPRLWIQIR